MTVKTAISNARKKLFDQFMAEGDTAGKANKWQEALDTYMKAQDLDNTQAVKTARAG